MQRALFLILMAGLLCGSPLFARDGTGYIVERIEVRGNKKTKPKVILRSLMLRKGDRLPPDWIARSRQALYRTRLFRTVHLASKPGTEEGKAVVVVYVDEKRFGDLGVSLEYTELDGFGIASDAYHVNLWGEGKVVGVEYGLGERLKHWRFSYTDPWLSGSNLSLHVQGSTSSSDRDLYRSKNPDARGRYDLERIGGSLGIGRPIGTAYRLIFKYSFEDVQVGDFRAPAEVRGGGLFAQEVGAAVGRKPVGFLGLDLHRRPSGRPWGSVPGVDLSLQVDFSATYLGSTANFLRLRTELYRHFETFSGQTFSLGGRAGIIFGASPFYERFFLDGPNQLRGMERREVGPEGGTRFVSAEGVYSVSLARMGRFYLFAEGAGIRRPVNGTVRKDAGATAGIGILLFNRIDISFGLTTGTLIVKSHRFGGINVGL